MVSLSIRLLFLFALMSLCAIQPIAIALEENENALSSLASVVVKQFKFEGNTVFSEAELRKVIADYENRQISAEELQEVRNKITLHYVEKGYINSGAIIPDQQVQQGVVTLQVIEGKLTQVNINGTSWLRQRYLRPRLLDSNPNTILNINDLQKRLQLLQQNNLIQRINAELSPDVNLGEGILNVNVVENRPYQLSFKINNHRSPSIGAYRGEIEGIHYNLTGNGDRLLARYGITEGLNDYALEYSLPITADDLTLTVRAERSQAQVVAEPFRELEIRSQAKTYAAGLTYPIYRTPNQTLTLGLQLELRESQTFLLKDLPYAFSSCVPLEDAESRIPIVHFTQDWLDRSRTHVVAARSSFNVGFDGLNAKVDSSCSPNFVTWLGQFQWLSRLSFLDSQLLFRTDVQLANKELLPLERFSIGGASTVRGYRENELTRDNGVVTSLEWRIPIYRLPIPNISQDSDDGWIQLAPFIDYGHSWNVKGSTPSPKDIYSIGLGIRWAPSDKLWAEAYWGKALRNLPEPEDEDLQDKGWHFELNWTL